MIRIKNTLIPQNTIKNIQTLKDDNNGDYWIKITFKDDDYQNYDYNTEKETLQALTNIHKHNTDNPVMPKTDYKTQE